MGRRTPHEHGERGYAPADLDKSAFPTLPTPVDLVRVAAPGRKAVMVFSDKFVFGEMIGKDSLMTQASGPVPTEVGLLYDQFNDTETLHFGYWETPEPDDSIEEAAPRLTDQVINRLGLSSGQRVLDAGCGIGEPAIRVCEQTGAHIVGVTVSNVQVQRATELAEKSGVSEKVLFQFADAMNLPFDDDSFDAAYALESVIHMDRVAALRELRRVVRAGGNIVFTDLFARAPKPAGKPSVIDQLVALWLLSEPIPIREYGPVVFEAGLQLREVKDITDQVLGRALRKFADRLRDQDTTSIPAEIISRLETDQNLQLAQFMDSLVASPELGYVIVSAKNVK